MIALAHTNKNPGPDGKPKYAGTTDILDDFDCAYVLSPVSSEADATEKLVFFENIKRRGDVARQAAYAYDDADGISYRERLLSVREVELTDAADIRQAHEIKADEPIIDIVTACIREGVDTKMALKSFTADRAGISQREALRVIERYTGRDSGSHRWCYEVGAHGAKHYKLLDDCADTNDASSSVPEPLTKAS